MNRSRPITRFCVGALVVVLLAACTKKELPVQADPVGPPAELTGGSKTDADASASRETAVGAGAGGVSSTGIAVEVMAADSRADAAADINRPSMDAGTLSDTDDELALEPPALTDAGGGARDIAPDSAKSVAAGVDAGPGFEVGLPGESGIYPELPIAVRFIALGQTEGQAFAAGSEFEECEQGLAEGLSGEQKEQPLWSECVAEGMVQRLNAELRRLLESDTIFFESGGFSFLQRPEYALVTSKAEEEVRIVELNESELAVAGTITVIISQWSHRGGGYAGVDRAVGPELGAIIMLSQTAGANVLVHEFGHIMGSHHLDEDESGTGVMSYSACGPTSAPLLEVCDCEFNLMQARRGAASCPECPEIEQTFSTLTHRTFYQEMADCWFSRRRFAGRFEICEFPELGLTCEGYKGTSLDCRCPGGDGGFVLSECAPLDAQTEQLYTEICTDSVCTSYEAYPGARCIDEGGEKTCTCLGDGRSFAGVECDVLSSAVIIDECVEEPVESTCTLVAGEHVVNCLILEDQSLACICSSTGALFRAGAGAWCDNIDPVGVAAGCAR